MTSTLTLGRTVRDALREARRGLAPVSDEAALEADLLLMHAVGVDRARLYQTLSDPIPPGTLEAYRRLLARRAQHEPTPYITGSKEFYGLDFEVTPTAIIPRPETELLVELAIAHAREHFPDTASIADIGTGSGVIAVSLTHSLPQAELMATDVSPEALSLARLNAARYEVMDRIGFFEGDLLNPLASPVNIIVANLPYVRTADWERLPPEIRDHEPRSGLDGGPDGLRVIEKLLVQAPAYLTSGGAIFAEIGHDQGEPALALARHALPQASAIKIERDLARLDRVLCVYT